MARERQVELAGTRPNTGDDLTEKVPEGEAREQQLAQLKQGNETPVPEKIPEREGEARERQVELAGTRPNTGDDLRQKVDEGAKGRAADEAPVSQKIDEREKGRAADEAAALFDTNRQYVSDAKKIAEEAPELLPKAAPDRHRIDTSVTPARNPGPGPRRRPHRRPQEARKQPYRGNHPRLPESASQRATAGRVRRVVGGT